MEFDIKEYLIENGFHQDQTIDKVFWHSDKNIKVKFIYPENGVYRKMAISDPDKVIPKTTHVIPDKKEVADKMIAPYISSTCSFTKMYNRFIVDGYLMTKESKAGNIPIVIAWVEVVDKKSLTSDFPVYFKGDKVKILEKIPEQSKVSVVFKINTPLIHNKPTPKLSGIDIWNI